MHAAADRILADAGNACPANYEKITSNTQCKLAEDYQGQEKDGTWPSGCYFCDGVEDCEDGTWFNKHRTGSANGGAQPWCTAAQPYGPYGGVLFAGDSDVEFWGTNDAFPGSSNTGVDEDTCKQVNQRLADELEQHNPTEVVLVCGENDLTSGASVETAFARWKNAVEKINDHGARVIYMGTKPEPDTKDELIDGLDTHAQYRAFDDLIRAFAIASGGKTVMVDVYPSFEALGNPNSLYRGDEVHLSGEGYSKWDAWVTAALADDDCAVWESGECNSNASYAIPPATLPSAPGTCFFQRVLYLDLTNLKGWFNRGY